MATYLLDFGLAQTMGEKHHGWGTPGYSAPEQYQKGSFVNQRTDIFEEMPGGNKSYIKSLDDALTEKASLILYVNKALRRQGKKKNEKTPAEQLSRRLAQHD